MPTWLLSKPFKYAASAVTVFLLAAGALKCNNDRVRRIDRAEQQVKELEAALVFANEAHRDAQARTDTVVRTVRVAVAGYAEQRARVDTITRNVNVPEGMVVVPIEFVRRADALAAEVQLLMGTIAQERRTSDSVIALQRSEIAILKVQVAAVRPGVQQKLTYAAVGAGIGVAVLYFLGGRN